MHLAGSTHSASRRCLNRSKFMRGCMRARGFTWHWRLGATWRNEDTCEVCGMWISSNAGSVDCRVCRVLLDQLCAFGALSGPI